MVKRNKTDNLVNAHNLTPILLSLFAATTLTLSGCEDDGPNEIPAGYDTSSGTTDSTPYYDTPQEAGVSPPDSTKPLGHIDMNVFVHNETPDSILCRLTYEDPVDGTQTLLISVLPYSYTGVTRRVYELTPVSLELSTGFDWTNVRTTNAQGTLHFNIG